MKVCELDGDLLDYWVAKAEGLEARIHEHRGCLVTRAFCHEYNFGPSSVWEHGGEIIEREEIMICPEGDLWGASPPRGCWNPGEYNAREMGHGYGYGLTPLIAAMRSYVISKYGETVPDPNEECIAQGGVVLI